MAGREEIVAYWLGPGKRGREQCSELIRRLALQFDAPNFEPHVTIYVTDAKHENPDAVLKKVLDDCSPIRLAVTGLDHSDKFTKTLFVQFAADRELTRLSKNFRRASVTQSDYELNPHLSLIYKEMDEGTKRRLVHSIALPFTEIVFANVKAIISTRDIKSREDVEAWRVVAEQSLGR